MHFIIVVLTCNVFFSLHKTVSIKCFQNAVLFFNEWINALKMEVEGGNVLKKERSVVGGGYRRVGEA